MDWIIRAVSPLHGGSIGVYFKSIYGSGLLPLVLDYQDACKGQSAAAALQMQRGNCEIPRVKEAGKGRSKPHLKQLFTSLQRTHVA
jgi:hypothetical protein